MSAFRGNSSENRANPYDSTQYGANADDVSAYRRDQYGSHGVKRAGKHSHKGAGSNAGQNNMALPAVPAAPAPSPASAVSPELGGYDIMADEHASRTSDGYATHVSADASPDVYGQPSSPDAYHEIASKRKRGKTVKKVLAIIGCVILALVLAVGAYAFWFTSSLDSELAPDEETVDELSKVLVPAQPGKPFYMLLIGSDSREGHGANLESEDGDNERSDVMMLARIDTNEKKLTLLSIPRDTPHKLENGSYEKINEVYNREGAAGTIRAVSELTGADISHYAEIHISGLQAIVDYLGGVEVDVPIALEYSTTESYSHIRIEAGRQTLNGQEAEVFARSRHEYETEQDVHRQDAVRQLVIAILDKTLKRPFVEIPGVVLEEAKYIDTDMKSGDIVSLAMGFADAGKNMKIYTGTGPTDGDFNPIADGQWMCYENPEGWKEVMQVVDAGEDPSGMKFSSTNIPWPESGNA